MVTFKEYSKNAIFFYEEEVPDLLIDSLKKISTKSFNLVDLGAGDGVLLAALQNKDLIGPETSITAVDLSPERCERLNGYSGIEVVCSDVTSILQIPGKSMDYVVSTQVIEHVDESLFLKEIKRLMKDGGVGYIASLISKYGDDKNYIYKYGWRYGWRFYKAENGRFFVDPTHLREYKSLEDYKKVFEENGFRVTAANEYPLKISLIDFIYRRIILKFINIKNVNLYFNNHKILQMLRDRIRIQPPGYYICEVIIEKK
jgi:ubiquinone/menaquinone biosynthesis C-methylase UbiE